MDFYNVDLYDMRCRLEGCDGANASARGKARLAGRSKKL